MVSEPRNRDITLEEEKQLEDRVNNLEGRIERMNSEICERIGAMKIEFQRGMAVMMEKLDWMMKKWDGQEDRTE